MLWVGNRLTHAVHSLVIRRRQQRPWVRPTGVFCVAPMERWMGAADKIRVGLLFSTTGPYATIGRAMRNGAQLAVEEVNLDPAFPFTIETVEVDAGGRNASYATAAEQMLAQDGLVHVVGCYTSSSRKEVLPFFESTMDCCGTHRITKVSRAASTSSTRGPRRTSISCRSPSISCRIAVGALFASARITSGRGKTTNHARGRHSCGRNSAGGALFCGRRD